MPRKRKPKPQIIEDIVVDESEKINYIFPHLGLGDYLIVNGLIRTIIKPDKQYTLFTNKNYEESIKFMFRDIENLSYKVIPQLFYNRYTILPYIREKNYNLIIIGYDKLNVNIPFEQSFYKQFNVPFENKWDKFYFKRDMERETKVFDSFDIKEDYAFVHEDVKRGLIINRKCIDKNLRIIEAKPGLTNNIFDYCKLIENAKEIHCIESSFMFLIDAIETTNNLCVHRYTKKEIDVNTLPTLKKLWLIFYGSEFDYKKVQNIRFSLMKKDGEDADKIKGDFTTCSTINFKVPEFSDEDTEEMLCKFVDWMYKDLLQKNEDDDVDTFGLSVSYDNITYDVAIDLTMLKKFQDYDKEANPVWSYLKMTVK